MKTADLTGALLDYWTARAEGVPADQLEIRPVQRPDPRTPDAICVHAAPAIPGWMANPQRRLDCSTNWALAGPLVEKHHLMLESDMGQKWQASVLLQDSDGGPYWGFDEAGTPLIAICRAVVRAAFGDEVPD